MNSTGGFTLNGRLEDSSSTSDSNANLSNSTQSKGAIPKTRAAKSNGTSKKPTKLNNNDEMLLPKNATNLTESVYQLHLDTLRINGYSESRIPGSYLDKYETAFYRSNSESCENCGMKSNGTSHVDENQITDECKDTINDFREPLSQTTSFQPSCSSREVDVNMLVKVETDSNSSDENELLSISDDGCIYTYKGDHAADLPSSFFSFDVPLPRTPELPLVNRQDNASPEMDYLEMDFDPGPSGDADSDSQSNADLENTENLPQDSSYIIREENEIKPSSDKKLMELPPISYTINCESHLPITRDVVIHEDRQAASTSSQNICSSSTIKDETPNVTSSITERIKRIRMPWSCLLAQRTTASSFISHSTRRLHYSHGELTLPTDKLSSPGDDIALARNIVSNGISDSNTMIWSEEEASLKQITQIGPSACGATAVINVLKALRLPLPSIEKVQETVKTRLRLNCSPLTEYLLSRSVAGSTHDDLIDALETLSEGQVYARFFHLYPERVVNLNLWLKFWISQGAVPIATLNLQKCAGKIPDAWHHQMIFGVGPREIFLTNPLECVDVAQLWPQLTSQSILLIQKEDVLTRWNAKTDLRQLMKVGLEPWCTLNVVGQVANIIRESKRKAMLGFANTTHIKIPAAYSAGITLAMRRDTPLCPILMYCPELPLLPSEEEAVGLSDIIF